MVRILIADDHPIVRRAAREIIGTQRDWTICAETADGSEVVKLALAERPNVAVIDVSMTGLSGVAATAHLKQALPSVEVLLFTMHDEEETIAHGLAAGAKGILLKTDVDRGLIDAIAALARHRSYFSPPIADMLL